jgi:hypothetical protein
LRLKEEGDVRFVRTVTQGIAPGFFIFSYSREKNQACMFSWTTDLAVLPAGHGLEARATTATIALIFLNT